MRHDIRVNGWAFALRPLSLDDAADIVALRTDRRLGYFIHATSENIGDQINWTARYFERPGDWYFAVVRADTGAFEGTLAIYDFDPNSMSAEWGRWILLPGSLAAIEAAALIYRAAFDVIGLESLYSRTFADNKKVVSFHDSSGARRSCVLPGVAIIGGVARDAIEHRVDRAAWREMAPRLDLLAARTGNILNRRRA